LEDGSPSSVRRLNSSDSWRSSVTTSAIRAAFSFEIGILSPFELDGMLYDCGGDGAVGMLRHAHELRQLEVRRAELFELLNDLVRVGSAKSEITRKNSCQLSPADL
jgi:hypothetical protein